MHLSLGQSEKFHVEWRSERKGVIKALLGHPGGREREGEREREREGEREREREGERERERERQVSPLRP